MSGSLNNPDSVCNDYYYRWSCGHEEHSRDEGCIFRGVEGLRSQYLQCMLCPLLTRMLDHTHVRTCLGDPGYECSTCGREPQPEPKYYPPMPEGPKSADNDNLRRQLDEYRIESPSYARFLERWQVEGIPRYVYTRPLTMDELRIDLQYLSQVLRAFIASKTYRYDFRPSQTGVMEFLMEWRGLADTQAETQAESPIRSQPPQPTQPTQSLQPQQHQQPVRRRRSNLNAYTAFRGEFIPGASAWSSNHRSRREAARARTEFFQGRQPQGGQPNGNRANTVQQPHSHHRSQRFDTRSQPFGHRLGHIDNHRPQPATRHHHNFNANTPRAPPLIQRPTPSQAPAQRQAYMHNEELARRFQEVSLAGNPQVVRTRL